MRSDISIILCALCLMFYAECIVYYLLCEVYDILSDRKSYVISHTLDLKYCIFYHLYHMIILSHHPCAPIPAIESE